MGLWGTPVLLVSLVVPMTASRVKSNMNWFLMNGVLGAVLALGAIGCGTVLREKPVRPDLNSSLKGPLTGEQSVEVLGTAASGWWYGQGLGETMLQAGTVFAFPPYVLMVLGNGALNIAGYESIGVSSFLDDEGRKKWQEGFGSVTSGPGRFTASISGREYKTEEVLLEDYKTIFANAATESSARNPSPGISTLRAGIPNSSRSLVVSQSNPSNGHSMPTFERSGLQ
jgi:hypothetical protein